MKNFDDRLEEILHNLPGDSMLIFEVKEHLVKEIKAEIASHIRAKGIEKFMEELNA